MSRRFTSSLAKARRGDPDAQYDVAVSLAVGMGTDADMAQAREWYERAARQDHPDAAFHLAAMLSSGEGGRRSKRDAMKWLRRASVLGSGDASIALAECEEDMATAAAMFARAALQGEGARALRGISRLLRAQGAGGSMEIAAAIQRELQKAGVA